MDDLLPEFIAETRETLEALSGEIVAWEADPADRARLDAIFRFVHTVKGSCGFLDLPRLARLSHAAEDALAAVRSGDRQPDTALVNAVLGVVDRIGELVEAIDAGVALDSAADDLLVAALSPDAGVREPEAPAAPAPVEPAPQPQGGRAAARSVRLGVELLDRMMSGMSDMVLARNELARRLREGAPDPRAEAALERLSVTVAEMRDTVTRTRMQKIDALFSALPRMVRDTAAQLAKQVTLVVEGSDVELDREMIEVMRDPLVHIIRNAIDHGVEAPRVRRAAGKREAGRVTVRARQSGNRILVEVSDDGAGIDVDRLIDKARRVGLVDPVRAAAMGEAARLDLIFSPGLSSRDQVSEVSGRGVGMDVVRSNVEAIGGRVTLSNRPGRGLTIIMEVPLTLSILSTIVVGVEGQRFALARQSVEEIVSLRAESVRVDRLGDANVAAVRGQRLPLLWLHEVLSLPRPYSRPQSARLLVIVSTRDGAFALGVDQVIDSEELVVKPAAPPVMACGLYAGQMLPDSGRPMLLLDGAGIAAAAGLRFALSADADAEESQAEARAAVQALLFTDLDGCRRAVPLGAVDRVETVDAGAVRLSGGRARLTVGDALVPLRAVRPPDEGRPVTLLRLTDGQSELAYAIAEPADIVDLPASLAPPAAGSPYAGVAVIGGEPVEVLDLLRVFADEGAVRPTAAAPPERVCLLGPDPSGWTDLFLRQLLEGAGYRCATRLAPGEEAAVALAFDQTDALPAEVPLVRLRREPGGGDGVYRYDRDALLAAVADHMGAECANGRRAAA